MDTTARSNAQFFCSSAWPSIDWQTLGVWLIAATFGIGGAISLALYVRDLPPRREAAVAAWDRFCEKLAATGLARSPSEGPVDFLARIRAQRPAVASSAEEITQRYVEARYGGGASREELRELARFVRRFRPA